MNRFAVAKRTAACLCFSLLFCSFALAFADEGNDDYQLAVGLYKKQRWAPASESFQKFLQENPEHVKAPFAQLYLGTTLRKLEKYDDARKVLREFVAKYPQNKNLPYAMFRVAECSYFLADYNSAETEFAEFLRLNPKHELNEWALPNFGDIELRLNKPEKAVSAYRSALDQFPQGNMAAESRFGLARALEGTKQFPEAIKIYEELAAQPDGPFAPQAHLNLATRAFDSGDFAAAAARFDELEKKFPQSKFVPFAQLNGGFAQFQLKNYPEAIARFEQAAKSKQHATTATFWIGICYKSLGEYAKAAERLKAAHDLNPKGPLAEEAQFQQADCEFRANHYDVARLAYLQVVASWPKGKWADDALHYAAESALLEKKIDDADGLLNRFEAEYPQSDFRPKHELLKGRLLIERGGRDNQNAAAAQFQKIIDGGGAPNDVSYARFHLARVQRQMGNDAAVVEVLAPLAESVTKEGAKSEFVDALVLYGNSLLATKQYDRAVGAMKTYLEFRPEDARAGEALATLALAQAHLGQKEQSQSNLAKLWERFPQKPTAAETTHQVAEVAMTAKDWDWALSLFNNLAERGAETPYQSAALSGKAWCLYQQQKFRESSEAFDAFLKAFPDDKELGPEAAYMRAKALYDAEDFDAAAAAFAAAFVRTAPEEVKPGDDQQGSGYYAFRAGLQAARTLNKLKRVKEASAAYEALLNRFPRPQDLDKLLDEWALLHYEAKEFERSDEIFRRLIQDVPESALVDNARLSLAESDHAAGRIDEAQKEFAALEADPKSEPSVQDVSLQHLIGISVERRDWKEVTALSDKLTTRFPESRFRYDAEFYKAEAQLSLGDAKSSLELLQALRKQDQNESVRNADWFAKLWILQAEIAFRNKDYKSIEALVEELRTTLPESPLLYQADDVLGRSLKSQGKLDEARAIFERVVEDKNGRRTETAAKCQFFIAETYLAQNNHKAAQQEYLKIVYLYEFPEWQAPALFQAAGCEEALNQWDEAVRNYEELISKFPESEFAAKAKIRVKTAREKTSATTPNTP